MKQQIAHVSVVVEDYDEAIAFYTKKLGFRLVEDSPAAQGKRWVLVGPRGSSGCSLLLARASTPAQKRRIGNQTGGRVFLFLKTGNFWRDYRAMLTRGVKFLEEPRAEKYGTVVIFEDLCGNKWDLVEAKKAGRA